MSEVKYSEAQFDLAAKIIQSLPPDGPVKPSSDDKLFVRYVDLLIYNHSSTYRYSFTNISSKVCFNIS